MSQKTSFLNDLFANDWPYIRKADQISSTNRNVVTPYKVCVKPKRMSRLLGLDDNNAKTQIVDLPRNVTKTINTHKQLRVGMGLVCTCFMY